MANRVATKTGRITKTVLVDRVADKAGITKADAKRTVDAILDTISEALARKEKVTLTGFGTFETRYSKERLGVNPQSGERLKIPGKHRPAFKPGAVLKRAIK